MSIKSKKQKNSFFLIELIVVIFIVSTASVFTMINISKAISKYNFEKSYKRIYDKFLFIKQLCFITTSDIICVIDKEKDGFFMEIKSLADMGILHEKKTIKEKFSKVDFEFNLNGKSRDSIKILFSSSGYFDPKAKIIIYSKRNAKLFKVIELEKIFVEKL